MKEILEQATKIDAYKSYIQNINFPCVAARAALRNEHIHCIEVGHMACPNDDINILKFIYNFVDIYRNSTEPFHSAAVIFDAPQTMSEQLFDQLLWQRLQALSNLDAAQ